MWRMGGGKKGVGGCLDVESRGKEGVGGCLDVGRQKGSRWLPGCGEWGKKGVGGCLDVENGGGGKKGVGGCLDVESGGQRGSRIITILVLK